MRVGLLVLLGVLVAFVPRHPADRSTSFPPGAWGRTIRCLEHIQSDRIIDSRTGRVPTADTTAVTVASVVHRYGLAAIRRTADPAAAHAVVRANGLSELSRADYRTSGQIVWAYDEDGEPPHISANAGDRALIAACVTDPRG